MIKSTGDKVLNFYLFFFCFLAPSCNGSGRDRALERKD